jgi:ATP-dependent DNA ligase
LKRAIAFDDPLRFTTHRNEDGEAYYERACENGWEGVIAKRADAPYSHSRSSDWLKFKCTRGQELVIGGFTEPHGSRQGFGALLVGYYDNGELRYAGKVGTGYEDKLLVQLRERLDRIARRISPFADEVKEKGVTWVQPKSSASPSGRRTTSYAIRAFSDSAATRSRSMLPVSDRERRHDRPADQDRRA